MYKRSKSSKKNSLFIYNLSQNSIFSLLGPSMVKNFTPFSQNGKPFTWVSSIRKSGEDCFSEVAFSSSLSAIAFTSLYNASMSFTSMAMWSMAPYYIFA